MATKKQRKRRQKEQRHDWEYVYVDEEGQEVEVDEAAAPAGKPARDEKAAPAKGKGRAGRAVEPASWRRSSRRAAIFGPFMLIVVYLLQSKGHKSLPGAVAQTIILIAVFVPFSYFLDSMLYRAYRKRTGGDAGGTQTKRR